LGEDFESSDEFAKMDKLYDITSFEIPEPLLSIKGKAVRFANVCNPSDMEQAVYSLLHIEG